MEESGVFGDSVQIIAVMTFIKLCWVFILHMGTNHSVKSSCEERKCITLFSGIALSIVISGVM
jgi:hypothetical protein